jgi:lipopolysaccharide assembly outer membrane protein LptD (OstA)
MEGGGGMLQSPKASGRFLPVAAALGVCAVALRLWAGPPAAVAPAENVKFPLEHYANGQVKTQITAVRASILDDGMVDAGGVRIELFKPDGSPDGSVCADQCKYDRNDGTAVSDSDVRIDRGGLVVTGTGFKWNAAEQTVRIATNAKVILPKNIRPALTKPAKENGRPQ